MNVLVTDPTIRSATISNKGAGPFKYPQIQLLEGNPHYIQSMADFAELLHHNDFLQLNMAFIHLLCYFKTCVDF